MRTWVVAAVWTVSLVAQAAWAQSVPQIERERIGRLVRDLAAPDAAVRDRAHQELLRCGPAVLPLLLEGARGDDPEVKHRAEQIYPQLVHPSAEQLVKRRQAVQEAFARADYGQMIALARHVTATRAADRDDWLWVGHACQLAGRWSEAVAAYQDAVAFMDAALKGRTAPLRTEVYATPEEKAEAAELRAPRRNAVRDRMMLSCWIARMQAHEAKDAATAAEWLQHAVGFAEQQKFDDGYVLPLVLSELGNVHYAAGDMAAALKAWGEIAYVQARRRQRFLDIERMARAVAQLPPDKPVPEVPWLFVLTPEEPKVTLALDEEGTRRRSWAPPENPDTAAWNYAFVPAPGKEFASVTFACDIEQIVAHRGGHLGCWALVGKGLLAAQRLGGVNWPGGDETGRAIVARTFAVPTGALGVRITTGSWKGSFHVHSVEARATFRTAVPRVKDEVAHELPDAAGLYGPDMVAGRGRQAEPFMNPDSPFQWQRTDLPRIGSTMPPTRVNLVPLPDESWLAIWFHYDMKIMLSSSKDLQEWTAPVPAPFNSVFHNTSPAAYVDEDGTVWLAFLSKRISLLNTSTGGFRLWLTSTRDGRRWTPLRPVLPELATGWPPGAAHLRRARDGKCWLFWRSYSGSADSFSRLNKIEPISVAGGQKNWRNISDSYVVIDPEGLFHMVFDRWGRGIYHATSKDGRSWSQPTEVVQTVRGQRVSCPQLVFVEDRTLLFYELGGSAYVTVTELDGPPLPPGAGVQITDHLRSLEGARLALPDDDRIVMLAVGSTPWLLGTRRDYLLNLRPPPPDLPD